MILLDICVNCGATRREHCLDGECPAIRPGTTFRKKVVTPEVAETLVLTPPKPQRKQTDFNVAEFDSDSTGYK